MAKKQSTKRAFDWRTYTKPVRLLSQAQEDALTTGVLEPLLVWAAADPRSRFEIRARSAGLYHRGVSLARVSGDGPFSAEIDPTDGAGAPERHELATGAEVEALVARLQAAREALDEALDSGAAPRNHRSYAAAIAAGNSGGDLTDDALLVVDADYALGRRKLDLVALVRSEGVSGPGGFASPDLAFIDVRVPGQSLTGQAGLAPVADDVADFAKALSGEHVRRTAEEIAELVNQKVRLGLLPGEIEVRSVGTGMPHILIAFAETDPTPPVNDPAIVELHERLAKRHYPTHRLSFVHFTETPEDGEGLALMEGDAMDYRAFKAYRYDGR